MISTCYLESQPETVLLNVSHFLPRNASGKYGLRHAWACRCSYLLWPFLHYVHFTPSLVFSHLITSVTQHISLASLSLQTWDLIHACVLAKGVVTSTYWKLKKKKVYSRAGRHLVAVLQQYHFLQQIEHVGPGLQLMRALQLIQSSIC